MSIALLRKQLQDDSIESTAYWKSQLPHSNDQTVAANPSKKRNISNKTERKPSDQLPYTKIGLSKLKRNLKYSHLKDEVDVHSFAKINSISEEGILDKLQKDDARNAKVVMNQNIKYFSLGAGKIAVNASVNHIRKGSKVELFQKKKEKAKAKVVSHMLHIKQDENLYEHNCKRRVMEDKMDSQRPTRVVGKRVMWKSDAPSTS